MSARSSLLFQLYGTLAPISNTPMGVAIDVLVVSVSTLIPNGSTMKVTGINGGE
jgi:hypothetical protein